MTTTIALAFIAPPLAMALFFAVLGVYMLYAVTKFILSLVTGG